MITLGDIKVTENARRATRMGCPGRRAAPHRPGAAPVVARPAATDRTRDPQLLATLTPNSGAACSTAWSARVVLPRWRRLHWFVAG